MDCMFDCRFFLLFTFVVYDGSICKMIYRANMVLSTAVKVAEAESTSSAGEGSITKLLATRIELGK